MTAIVKNAFHVPSKKIINIKEAANGLACQCKCLQCNEPLEAIQGRKRRFHFRHYTKKDCGGAPELVLHLLAKQILCEIDAFAIPGKIKTLYYSHPVKEEPFETITPDITAYIDSENVFFEVLVTHKNSEIKESFYISKELKSIEINLSKTSRQISPYKLREQLINDPSIKRIIFWEKQPVIYLPPSESRPIRIYQIQMPKFDWLELLSFIFLLFIGIYLFKLITTPLKKRR